MAAAQILIKKEKKSFQAWRVLKKIYAHDTKKEALNWVEKDGKKVDTKEVLNCVGSLRLDEKEMTHKKAPKLIFVSILEALKFNWFDSIHEEENENVREECNKRKWVIKWMELKKR